MKKRILLLSLIGLIVSCGGGDVKKLIAEKSDYSKQSLNEGWEFCQVGQNEWLPAVVPGVVHTDLMNNNKIEEPFGGTAEGRLQWIEKETWEYRTSFTPSAEAYGAAVKELVFKGLDTYADVYLNDSLVLKADNMFLEWRIGVDGLLKEGSNALRVVFHPAYAVAEPLAKAWPVKLPADNDKGEPWKTSVFTRKAPYSFGWDWGPRYATVGMWRPVSLETFNGARIENTQYIQKNQSVEKADFDVHISLAAAKEENVDVYIADSTGKVYAQTNVALKQGGDNKVQLSFTINNPRLWWPNGAGDPNLYAFKAIVSAKGVKYDQKEENIGVRTVKLIQEKDSVGEGVSFYFEVNGEPIFSKGANYIPQDAFLPRVTADKYQEMISVTKESHMNMLRVWGGGIYEEDMFYDLCDKNGIMVWQDFIFGCSLYPWNKEFLDNVEKEAIYNVRRLRNHPSIVIWCGNNEITELWHHWGYQKAYGWNQQEKDMTFAGMEALFYKLLPDVLAVEDTTRYYHPSSPLYGRGNPKSQIMGDVHYWGVFHDEEPFSVYKDKPGRFSNEYGFMSLACYDTYREYLTPEEIKLYSPAMVTHQKNPKGYRVMEEYMVRDLPLLKDNFRTYVYLTQLLQAEGIKIAMEGHRGKRPWTMGSVYWQINDCWPVASWSSIDSEMRWKALHFYARRSFAPTILSFEKIDSSSMVKLRVLNDVMHEMDFQGTLTLQDFDGQVLSSEEISGKIPSNANLELLYAQDSKMLQYGNGLEADPRKVMLVARGTADGLPLEAFYYFTPYKDLLLPKADFSVDYKQNGKHVVATLTANKLLKSVLFEAEALQLNPSDAYFDLLPGESKEITLQFKDDKPIDQLGIFLTSLNNLVGRPSDKPITQNVK